MSDMMNRLRRDGIQGHMAGVKRTRLEAGMSLIEVLVSVLILGIGLLGIAAMQATALRNGQSSLERTQAVIQSYAILDAIRANRTDAIAGYYNTGGTEPRCAAVAPEAGSPAGQMTAQAEVNAWLASLKTAIVGQANVAADTSTCGRVQCAANTIGGATCTVMVQWDDSRGSTASPAGEEGEIVVSEGSATRQVVTVAAI